MQKDRLKAEKVREKIVEMPEYREQFSTHDAEIIIERKPGWLGKAIKSIHP